MEITGRKIMIFLNLCFLNLAHANLDSTGKLGNKGFLPWNSGIQESYQETQKSKDSTKNSKFLQEFLRDIQKSKISGSKIKVFQKAKRWELNSLYRAKFIFQTLRFSFRSANAKKYTRLEGMFRIENRIPDMAVLALYCTEETQKFAVANATLKIIKPVNFNNTHQ